MISYAGDGEGEMMIDKKLPPLGIADEASFDN